MPSDPAAEGPALIPRMTQLTSCRKIPRKEAVFRIRRMVPLALLPARAQALRLATLPTSEALGLKPAAYMMTWLRRGHLPLQHHTRVPRDPTVLIDGVDRSLAPPRLSLSSPGRLNNLCLLKHRRCSTRVSCCLLRNMFLRWLMWTCQPRTLSRKPWLFCRLTAPLLWLTASLRLCRSTLSLCLRMPCAWHCLSGVTLNTSCLTARGSTVPSSVHLVQRLPIAPLSLPFARLPRDPTVEVYVHERALPLQDADAIAIDTGYCVIFVPAAHPPFAVTFLDDMLQDRLSWDRGVPLPGSDTCLLTMNLLSSFPRLGAKAVSGTALHVP